MGITAVLPYAHGQESDPFHVPLWVVLSCRPVTAATDAGGVAPLVRPRRTFPR